jgi:hypothetical protein
VPVTVDPVAMAEAAAPESEAPVVLEAREGRGTRVSMRRRVFRRSLVETVGLAAPVASVDRRRPASVASVEVAVSVEMAATAEWASRPAISPRRARPETPVREETEEPVAPPHRGQLATVGQVAMADLQAVELRPPVEATAEMAATAPMAAPVDRVAVPESAVSTATAEQVATPALVAPEDQEELRSLRRTGPVVVVATVGTRERLEEPAELRGTDSEEQVLLVPMAHTRTVGVAVRVGTPETRARP